jgi:hypothetical protein
MLKVADFHVKVWRHTYRDLAPTEAHAVIDERHRGRKWEEKLSSNDSSQIVLIAEIDGKMVGIEAVRGPSEARFGERGEIKFFMSVRTSNAGALAARCWHKSRSTLGAHIIRRPL